MKRIITALIILCVLISIMTAAAESLEYKQLADDILLQLYEDVGQELRNRGVYPFVELKNGASGDEVAKVQRRLAELGYGRL